MSYLVQILNPNIFVVEYLLVWSSIPIPCYTQAKKLYAFTLKILIKYSLYGMFQSEETKLFVQLALQTWINKNYQKK
jgi:hypothetical protein